MSAIRIGNWKLVRLYESGESRLFDLASDVGETGDLSAENPEIAQRLSGRLASYLEAVEAPMAKHRK